MKNPKVSIILSVYNEEGVLEECIESLLNQTYNNIEIICIDDGSEDSSREILKKYDSENEKINFVPNQKNIGLTKSLNKGIDIAEGKYIARQDADDCSLENRIEKQVQYMEDNPEVFLTGQHSDTVRFYDEFGNLLKKFRPEKKKELDLEERVSVIHSSIMFQNDSLKYREKFRYSQDYDLYLRIKTDRGKIETLDDEILYKKIQLDSISSRNNVEQSYFREKAREFYYQRKKRGKDRYDDWKPNPPEQKVTEKSKKKHYYQKKMEYSMESGNKELSQKFYEKYSSLSNVSVVDKIKWKIAVNSLIVFNLYRKIFV